MYMYIVYIDTLSKQNEISYAEYTLSEQEILRMKIRNEVLTIIDPDLNGESSFPLRNALGFIAST